MLFLVCASQIWQTPEQTTFNTTALVVSSDNQMDYMAHMHFVGQCYCLGSIVDSET
jgi:hypothetical protein